MLKVLEIWDRDFLFMINGEHAAWLDRFMILASGKFTWIFLYVILLVLMFKKMGWKAAIVSALLVVPLIVLTDQVSASLIKPLVERLRPCHQHGVMEYLVMPKHCPPGEYGFVSSHAANMFGLVVYLVIILSGYYKHISWVLFPVAILVGYSRIYLGFHYPGDVICGGLIGAMAGFVVSRIQKWILSRFQQRGQA